MNPAGANGGGEWIQAVAAQTDDGGEHLLDDTRYDAPTFAENCGRSSMSLKVGSGSMNKFGFTDPAFIKTFRVLDGDACTLAPGNAWFEACGPSKATLVCTTAKP